MHLHFGFSKQNASCTLELHSILEVINHYYTNKGTHLHLVLHVGFVIIIRRTVMYSLYCTHTM